MPIIMLVDNGSVRSEATITLRELAQALSLRADQPIFAVSLQHANTIPADQLAGEPASTFVSFMRKQLAGGEREFVMLPLFFGESKALTAFVPEQLDSLRKEFGEFKFAIADVIYPLPQGDQRLVEILHSNILMTAYLYEFPLENIVLVDHGSPVARVTAVRQYLVEKIQAELPADVRLDQAVMERRPGKEYDFNGDLLEDWLTKKAKSGVTTVIVALMFFLAGRHAGANGDIETICNKVMTKYPDFSVVITPLISENEGLLDILFDRLNAIKD